MTRLALAFAATLLSSPASAGALDPTPQERVAYCQSYSVIINELQMMRSAGMSAPNNIRQFFAAPLTKWDFERQGLLARMGRDKINTLMDKLYASHLYKTAELQRNEAIKSAYSECVNGKLIFIDD